MNVTTQPTGHEHSYVLVDGAWVATVLNEYAEVCREAIASPIANRTDNLQTHINGSAQ